MKLLSLNIWDLPLWFVKNRTERVQNIANHIIDEQIDIVCLQESFDLKNRQLLQDLLSKKGYHSTALSSQRKILWLKFDTTGGLTIFSKFPIISSSFKHFHRGINSSFVEFFSRKGFLETSLQTDHGKLKVVTTHLHEESTFFDKTVRQSQLTEMFDVLNKEGNIPTILAGDFNENHILEDSKFAHLFKSAGFSHPSSMHSIKEPTYRPENQYVDQWINRIDNAKRIDYIFVKDMHLFNLEIEEYNPIYLSDPLSDHDPLMLTLKNKGLKAT